MFIATELIISLESVLMHASNCLVFTHCRLDISELSSSSLPPCSHIITACVMCQVHHHRAHLITSDLSACQITTEQHHQPSVHCHSRLLSHQSFPWQLSAFRCCGVRYYITEIRWLWIMQDSCPQSISCNTSLDKSLIRWWLRSKSNIYISNIIGQINWAFTVWFAWSCKIIFVLISAKIQFNSTF